MREMEIDLTKPWHPVLWVKGHPIRWNQWAKATAGVLISRAGFSGMSKKEKAISFYRHYGVPASVCAKFLNNGLIKMSVGALKGHESLCYNRSRFCTARTIDACEMKDELDQAVLDGNKNITPFIARLKRNPKELKELLGTAVWKQLCKNTFTRNKGLAELLYGYSEAECKTRIIEIIKVPSGILKYKSLASNVLPFNYMNKKCGISLKKLQSSWKSDSEVYKMSRIISDTRNMAEEYGEKFSYDWSWRKMQEKHDYFTKEATRLEAERMKRENEKYSKPLREGQKKVWTVDGVEAKFLDTFESILEEGRKMHHCVGYYAQQCYDNQYAVFHISGDAEETTLGVLMQRVTQPCAGGNQKVREFNYSIQQHYGLQNAEVKSERHRAIAKMIIKELNEEEV